MRFGAWFKVRHLLSRDIGEDFLDVKLYRRLGKKRHLNGKHVYKHERIYVPIPSRLHDMIKPFLNQRLEIEMKKEEEYLTITLRIEKTVLPAELTRLKSHT